MRCPFCNNDDTNVKDSRPSDDGRTIRRRRECPECGRRFTTFERFSVQQLVVVKRAGQREMFDREKLTRSLLTALRKRPVTQVQIAQLVSDIETQFTEASRSEVASYEIGEAVLAGLKGLDFIGYIRYASVYHEFKGIEDFAAVLAGLKE
jgi:transcriptional repressor NrdR